MSDESPPVPAAAADRTAGAALASGWTLALGLLLLLLGFAGFGATFALTLTTVMVFGWFLVVGGVVQLVASFTREAAGGRLGSIAIAILYVAAGAMLLARPLAGSAIITMLIGLSLVLVGASRCVVGLAVRRETPAWLLVLLSGVASLAIGALILARWPGNSVWVIGLFVAIELFVQGWTLVAIWFAARAARDA